MGIVGGKFLIFIIVIFIGLGVAISNEYVTWRKDDYGCYNGRGFYGDGTKRILAIGSLNFNYPVMAFGCNEDHHYDTSKYTVENGQLVPK